MTREVILAREGRPLEGGNDHKNDNPWGDISASLTAELQRTGLSDRSAGAGSNIKTAETKEETLRNLGKALLEMQSPNLWDTLKGVADGTHEILWVAKENGIKIVPKK